MSHQCDIKNGIHPRPCGMINLNNIISYGRGTLPNLIDEYANSDELIFIKDDFTYYEKDIDGLKLPPNYLPFFGKDIVKNKQKNSQTGRHVKFVTQPEFLTDYKISLKSTTRKITFSLHDYVFF